MRRRAAVVALVLAVACTQELEPVRSPTPSPSRSVDLVEVRTGRSTALEAMSELCIQPDIEPPPVTPRPVPPAIAEVMRQVEAVRGLRFLRPVNVEPVTPGEIDRRLSRYFEDYYPHRFYARRTDAWATIGAIPDGVGILEALNRYQQGQVLGFYNSQNEELVYTGDAELNRIEQFVLAHELTHAIDDQHFDLDRLDRLALTCDDERSSGALGVVEGSANYFATQVVLRFPVSDVGSLPSSNLAGVPPLIVELQAYPYTSGQAFADSLADVGGPGAVDRALEQLPTTTEQVLHPSKYPEDQPEDVDVPDFAPTFGRRWRDHDVMLVGEAWLQALLNLRLDEPAAAGAAAGWDGGIYRAWSDGRDVAVVMRTVWDTTEDASEFAGLFERWIGQGSGPGLVLQADGNAVNAGFVSRDGLLPELESVLRAL